MKKIKYLISYLIGFTIIFALSGCTNNQIKKVEFNIPKLSKVNILKKEKDHVDIYIPSDEGLEKTQEVKNIYDLKYNLKNNTYVQIKSLSKGKNLDKNELLISTENKKYIFDVYYAIKDVKLSPDGNKIAFRCFTKDSLDSAQGLKIYDIKKGREVNINSKVLVSGNLYKWLNEEEILYYGIEQSDGNRAKLYKYNLENQNELIYVDNLIGYTNEFILLKKDMIFFQNEGDNLQIYLYDTKSRAFNKIISGIDKIYDYTIKDSDVYLIGKNKETQKNNLYLIDGKNIFKINYDFPKELNKYGRICSDDYENIYFTGFDHNTNNQNDVYRYNIKEKSIDLISDTEGYYYIIGEK